MNHIRLADSDINAVFWDYDGVISDTVSLKSDAFASLFEMYGEDIVKKVIDYHIANGGVSRSEKIKYFYENFIKIKLSDYQLNKLCDKFSSIVLQKVLNQPLKDGIIESLKYLKEKNILQFVVSGTPESEMRYIIKEKKIDSFFKGVYGSPQKKDVIFEKMITLYNLNINNCICIGDSITDYTAALNKDIKFIGILNSENDNIFPNTIQSFKTQDLPELIAKSFL